MRLLPAVLLTLVMSRSTFGQTYTIYTVAGNGTGGYGGYGGDNGPATSAELYAPYGVAVDSVGNVYIADTANNRVRKVSNGVITTVAGGGSSLGNNGPATSAQLEFPFGVAVDSAGNLYIADTGNDRIRKVSNGVIITVAGNGTQGFSGDNAPATSAQMNYPWGVTVDPAGNVYIADSNNNRVRKVSNGVIATVAGNGSQGFSGDGGPATSAQLWNPAGVAVDSAGNLYIADYFDGRIRILTPTGSSCAYSTYSVAPTSLQAPAVGGNLTVNIQTGAFCPWAVSGLPGWITVSGASSGAGSGFVTLVVAPNSGTALSATISIAGVSVTVTQPAAATASQAPIMGVNAAIDFPNAVVTDASGDLYFSTDSNPGGNFDVSGVFKIDRSGVLTVVAGNSVAGYSGDGGPAVYAQLNYPQGLALDAAGSLYIADYGNNRIRRVSTAGSITTIAGNGVGWYSGDGGPAISAEVEAPVAAAVDGAGNIYVVESFNYTAWVREISPDGIITKVIGPPRAPNCPVIVFLGPGTPATCFDPDVLGGIAVDNAGDLYISDQQQSVYEVSASGVVTAAFDNFSGAEGVAVDNAGNLYVADAGNNRICKVTPAGIVTAVAGSGTQGYSGDGGPAVQAQLNGPTGVAFDSGGNLYISDWGNQRIRKVSSGSGIISTVAGGGSVRVPSTGPPAISNVVNGASFQPGIVANSWITILGTNLSSTTDTWANAIVNGKLPTSLDGVSVDVNGLPAYISYISPNQINAVSPSLPSGIYELTSYTISVTVSAPSGTSDVFWGIVPIYWLGYGSGAVSETLQPAFFLWPGGYAVATKQDYSWAVKNGTFAGTTTAPARPGDVVTLWGTGFGPTSPTAPVGAEIPTGTLYNTASPVTVTVGGKTAVVYGAVLSPGYAGLYQVAIQIPPSLGNGDYPVIATVNGAQSPAGVSITVQQ